VRHATLKFSGVEGFPGPQSQGIHAAQLVDQGHFDVAARAGALVRQIQDLFDLVQREPHRLSFA